MCDTLNDLDVKFFFLNKKLNNKGPGPIIGPEIDKSKFGCSSTIIIIIITRKEKENRKT